MMLKMKELEKWNRKHQWGARSQCSKGTQEIRLDKDLKEVSTGAPRISGKGILGRESRCANMLM